MISENQMSYWMALGHLPRWGNEKINSLLVDIVHNKKFSLGDFFSLAEEEMMVELELSSEQVADVTAVKNELANYAFLAEELTAQGFQMVPFISPAYSDTLKENLKTKDAPPLLYVKGNLKLLNQESVAIVGSRTASSVALEFTKNIAKKCADEKSLVVSGFAKGVDRTALDCTLEFNGQSIVVLPQGILTFGSGIKKYYKKIIDGDVLILSTFHPKAPWAVGLAMSRNRTIYGLARTIYVAESENKGGTWNGILDGLQKGRKVFIRNPETSEKNANSALIMYGADPVDLFGRPLKVGDNILNDRLKAILSEEQLTAKGIIEKLNLDIDPKDLQKILSRLAFIESKKVKNRNYYFNKNSIPAQQDLFE